LILAKGIIKVFGENMKANYPPSKAIPTSSIHHHSGIVAFGSGKSQRIFPNWEYPEVLSNPPGVCFS